MNARIARAPATPVVAANQSRRRGPDSGAGGFDAVSFWSRGGVAYMLSPPEGPLTMPRPALGDGPCGMFLAGGPDWDRWNKVVRDQVVRRQVKAGCERGSWPPDDRWGASGGRVYSTSLAILTLEVYYRFARKDAPDKAP